MAESRISPLRHAYAWDRTLLAQNVVVPSWRRKQLYLP
jgi:hypothetical protein